MKHFVFCHGFAFDRSFWKNLSGYFSQEHCTYVDLGYFNDPAEFYVESHCSQLIGIGHSLGLLKLLSLKKNFDHLIGLNAFTNFLGFTPALQKQRVTELEQLKKQFIQSPIRTLNRFYHRCGVAVDPPTVEKIDLPRILRDLDSLKENGAIPTSSKALIIGARDDIIVPPAILQDNFKNALNTRVEIVEQGQHGLGFFKAQWVSEKIMSFINDSEQ